MASKQGILIQDVHLGGIADSPYSGLPNSLASIVGLDLHSVPGLMLVNQKLTHHSPTVGGNLVDDLCKIVPCSDGNIYLFGKTTGKVWKVTPGGVYTLETTIKKTIATAFTSPGTVADDASIGTIAWSDVNNAKVSDDTYTYVVADGTSHYLKCTNFGFAIPNGATVLGIVVEIERAYNVGGSVNNTGYTDNSIKLVKGGTILGENKAKSEDWVTNERVASYGSSNDLWGTSFTPANINAADFGVAISVVGVDVDEMDIDHVRIKVIYNDPAVDAAILDAKEYYGYIYYAMQGYGLGRWRVGSAWADRVDGYRAFINGDTEHHPMTDVNLITYIGDGNVVAQIDASDSSIKDANGLNEAIFTDNALDIEETEIVTTLSSMNTSLLVGSKRDSNINRAGVFVWNTWTESFDLQDHITENGINAFLPHNSEIIVNAGLNGNLYVFNGSKLIPMKQIPPNFPTLYSPTNTGKVYHSAVDNKMGIPIFGFSRVTGNPALQGIYSFGYRNISYPRILTLEYPMPPLGSLSNITIWSLAYVGNDLYVSYLDETGATSVGIAKLDWDNKIDGAYFETKVIRYTKTLMDTFTKFVVDYNQHQAGSSIELWYKKNHGAYAQIVATTELVNDVDRKQYLANLKIEAKTIQFMVVVRTIGNNAASVEDLVSLF